MKIRVNKNDMMHAIGVVQKAVSSRPSIPILKGILLVTGDSSLFMTANDLQIGIETSIPCEVHTKGAVVVDAKLLGDVVRHIRDEYLSFEVLSDLAIKIQNRDLDISLKGYNNQEFPDLPIIGVNEGFAIRENIFADMLSQTLFAVADTEFNQIINGVLFKVQDNQLTLAASDGFRFALREQSIENMNNLTTSFVVPGHTLREIRKLLGDSDQYIKLAVDKNHVVFTMGSTRIISRLLDGEFIKYEAIMPKTYYTHVLLDSHDLLDALGINSVLASKQNSSVVLNIEKDHVEVRSQSEVGKISKKIRARVEGDPLKIGFNIRYLTDGIKANNEERTRISFVKGMKSPGVITSKDKFKYLLLPVMVSDIDD